MLLNIFKKIHYWEILNCWSISYHNLYFGGRGISADAGAIASARVMGICLQTGYAVGLLAAYKIKGLGNEDTLRIIQKEQL